METPRQYPFMTRDDLDFGGQVSFGLRVDVVAHSTDPLQVRGFTKAGSFVHQIVPVGNGDVETFNLAIADVPISVTSLFNQIAFSTPLAYVSVHLTVNGNRIQLLCQGTIGTLFGINWPNQVALTFEQSHGAYVELFPAAAAAGQEFQLNVPDNEVWEILMMSLTLTAAATVATRTAKFIVTNVGGAHIQRTAPATQIISEQVAYDLIPGGTSAVITASARQEVGFPQRMFIAGGGDIETVTTNLQAGDVWSVNSIGIRRNYSVTNL